jgi:hypothetical protein
MVSPGSAGDAMPLGANSGAAMPSSLWRVGAKPTKCFGVKMRQDSVVKAL